MLICRRRLLCLKSNRQTEEGLRIYRKYLLKTNEPGKVNIILQSTIIDATRVYKTYSNCVKRKIYVTLSKI